MVRNITDLPPSKLSQIFVILDREGDLEAI